MSAYLSETLHRFCTRDVYDHWNKHRAAYQWILAAYNDDNDSEFVTTKGFAALLTYLDKQGRCPSSPDAMVSYILSNPDRIPSFRKSLAYEEDFRSLKDFTPICEDMDNEVLFTNLLGQAKFDHYNHGLATSARIAIGSTVEKGYATGPDGARLWLNNYLSTTGYKETEDSLVEDTTGLEFAGVCVDDDGDTRTMRVETMEQVEMTELKWLWPDKIPSGNVCILSGKPGKGKTLTLIDWVARVTTGSDWPDGAKNEYGPRKVLLCSAEDGAGDTIKPRLVVAGADLSKVLRFRMTTRLKDSDNEHSAILNLKKDLIMLTSYVEKNPDISVLVLDPLSSYIGGVNLNKDEEIHPLMDKLILLGHKTGLTIFALVHSNKRSDVDAMQQVMGAASVAGSARTVWTFAQDTEDETLYRMVNTKGNLLRNKNGFEYQIVGVDIDINGKLVNHPRIQWGKETNMRADDVLKAERNNKDSKDTKSIMATAIIKSMLPCKAKDVYRKAEDEGVSIETIKRAKYQLAGIVTRQRNKEWWWWFEDNPPAPDTTKQDVEAFKTNEDAVTTKLELAMEEV
jgi:putative DNA primase/helicase